MWNRKLEDEVNSPTKVSDSRKLEPDAHNFSRSGGIQAKKNFRGNTAMSCNSKYGKNKFGQWPCEREVQEPFLDLFRCVCIDKENLKVDS